MSFNLLCTFCSNFWCHVLQYVINLYIGSVSTLSGIYYSYSYATMGVGVDDFEFCLDVGAGFGRLLGSFTLIDAVVLGGF